MQLKIHDYGLVVLVGPSGSGKTTFAERHFHPSEVLSSDHYRSVVGDDDRNATTTKDAFDVIEAIATRRLRSRRLVVIDATNVAPDDRKRYVRLARDEHAPLSAIASTCRSATASHTTPPAARTRGPHTPYAASGARCSAG